MKFANERRNQQDYDLWKRKRLEGPSGSWFVIKRVKLEVNKVVNSHVSLIHSLHEKRGKFSLAKKNTG